MKLSKSILKPFLFLSFLSFAVFANNLNVTNFLIKNISGGTADIQFDLSWSNSYRWMETVAGKSITNHDAAWIFIKFRNSSIGKWKHALLTSTGHSVSPGSILEIYSNGAGTNVAAMVYRSDVGNGALVNTNMTLRWDMSKNGLTKTNFVDIRVFAIEMVKIPECRFALGSGGTESSHFYEFPYTLQEYYVTNAGAINVGANTGELYYSGNGDRTGPIPAAFPNGFSAFYCMKYEITQSQYTDFLRSLPPGDALVRFPNEYGNWRHTIKVDNGVYSVDVHDRACNYLGWTDVSAYLDWAALRPMTELEFEKACRGPLTPIPNEYVWGNTFIRRIDSYDGVDGSGTETAFPTNANCHYHYYGAVVRMGPTRAGIFARAGTTRSESGAGYYGVMDLGGNVCETIVTIGNVQGRAFIGNHGDGSILTAPPTWPVSTGIGCRGGYYDYNAYVNKIRISDRYNAEGAPGRSSVSGGRGVRSAQ